MLSRAANRAKSSRHPQKISCLVRSWYTRAKPPFVSKELRKGKKKNNQTTKQQKKVTCLLKLNKCIFHYSSENGIDTDQIHNKNLTSDPGDHCSKQQCNCAVSTFPICFLRILHGTQGTGPLSLPPPSMKTAPFRETWTKRSSEVLFATCPLTSITESSRESPTAQNRPRYRAPGHSELPSKT